MTYVALKLFLAKIFNAIRLTRTKDVCFAETKLDDSANPVAPNIPGDLSLEPGKMNLVWIKEEQFLFLPNMSAAHFTS